MEKQKILNDLQTASDLISYSVGKIPDSYDKVKDKLVEAVALVLDAHMLLKYESNE